VESIADVTTATTPAPTAKIHSTPPARIGHGVRGLGACVPGSGRSLVTRGLGGGGPDGAAVRGRGGTGPAVVLTGELTDGLAVEVRS
jgi:hypothetical protein